MKPADITQEMVDRSPYWWYVPPWKERDTGTDGKVSLGFPVELHSCYSDGLVAFEFGVEVERYIVDGDLYELDWPGAINKQ